MNGFNVIMKLLAAAAIIAGALFVVITYGDKILSFVKKLLGRVSYAGEDCDFVDECDLEDDEIIAGEQDFEA